MQSRVLLADDHPHYRYALRCDLSDDGLEVCAEAADAEEAFSRALREQPDVCLLDVRMPGSGITAAWRITERLASTKVLMLSVSRSDAEIVAAVAAGATGYLLKDADTDSLATAVRDAAAGAVTLPAEAATPLLAAAGDRLDDDDRAALGRLAEGVRTPELEGALRRFRAHDPRSAVDLVRDVA